MSIGTESSVEKPSQDEQNEAAVREGISLAEGVRRLGKMIGLKSVSRNLEAEDAAIKRDYEIGQSLYGGAPVTQPSSDEMDVMAARDVIVNHNHAAPATPAVTPAPATSLAKKAAIAAALVGGGAAAPLLYQYFNQEQKATVVAPEYDPAALDLLPPDPAPVN